MTRISVVIPTHDRAELVVGAVRSALDQTRPPSEVIVVDDGSTDETPAVCRGFRDPVRYIRQENAGVSAARNHGVREAAGDLIAFLDSDDLWEPTKLEVQGAVFSAMKDVGWSVCDSTIVGDGDLPWPGKQGFARGFAVFSDINARPEQLFDRWLHQTELVASGTRHVLFTGWAKTLLFHGNCVQPSALMVRRDVFSRSGGFDESLRLAEDTDLALRLASAAPVAILMDALVRWRIGSHESLVSPDTAAQLTRTALRSLDKAAQPAETLTPEELDAYEAGRRRLWQKLAYTQLSNLDRDAVRATVATASDQGVTASLQLRVISAAARLPSPILRLLHAAKRAAASSLGVARR